MLSKKGRSLFSFQTHTLSKVQASHFFYAKAGNAIGVQSLLRFVRLMPLNPRFSHSDSRKQDLVISKSIAYKDC